MFSDYYKSVNTDKEVVILDVNSLFSLDTQMNIVSDAVEFIKDNGKEDYTNILIKYKVKASWKATLMEELDNLSTYIIKFDLFSTHPEVLKGSDSEELKILTENWEERIERLNS